jgi:ATP:ADP antiporter, AAA family
MFRGLTGIRPEERRGAAAAFATNFGILAAHTLLETARDALFLSRLPARQLPFVYLIIALVAVGISQVRFDSRRFTGRGWGLPILLLGCASITFLFWLGGAWRSPVGLYALYVWTGLVGSLAVLQLWLVLGDLYTVSQAKRVFSVVGTGSLLGAAAGAGLARVLALSGQANVLVLAAAITMAATAVGPALLLRSRTRGTGSSGGGRGQRNPTLQEAIRLLKGHAYVRALAVFVLVSTVALTLADYVFKSVVARNIPPEELGYFFANLYLVMNALALVAQLLLTDWLFRVLGLHRALWALPTLLFLGAAGVALGGGLVAALLMKGADGALRNSLHRTGSELLYVPLPDALRSRAKPFIDLVGQRGGQALASLLILSEVMLRRGDVVLSGASAALSLVWIAWAADLKGLYLDLFRSALREGTIERSADLPPLDLGSLEALFAALNSADDGEVIGAMDLLAEEGRARLIPALILYHPSRTVVLRAFEILSVGTERTDFLPIAARLLSHRDAEIRAAALRARTAAASDESLLRAAGDDPSPLVRATALAGLVAGGWITDEAQSSLESLLEAEGPQARLALAQAIRAQPAPVFEDVLISLAERPESEVQVEAAAAMAAIKSPRFFPALLPLLAQREARPAAREALVAHGSAALEFLDQSLSDGALPHDIRRHLPRTISLFLAQPAVEVLERHLLVESDGMVRYKILRGLNRLSQYPEVAFDGEVLARATAFTLEAAFRLVDWRLGIEAGAAAEPRRATPGHGLLVALLHDKEAHAFERVTRLLALQYRAEDFKRIFWGLRNEDPKVRASSRELLQNVVEPPLRDPLLAFVDDLSDREKLLAAAPIYAPQPVDYETLLGRLLEQPGESVRCIAAYHVGELGLRSLRPRLLALQQPGAADFFLSRIVERALSLLAPPAEERAAHA